MSNVTYSSRLVRRLTNDEIQTISIEDRNTIRNYSIVAIQAATVTSKEDDVDVFAARSRRDREQWWKFWEYKKNDTAYIYYLVDMRDRNEKLVTIQTALDNKYSLKIAVTISYNAEDPRQVALGTEDPLGRLVGHFEEIVRKFVLKQDDFVALHDVELVLDAHLKQNDVGFFNKWGLRVFDAIVEIELPQQYYDDLKTHKDNIDKRDREESERKREEEERKALADHEVMIRDIEAAKEQELQRIEAEHKEAIEQIQRSSTNTDIKTARRQAEFEKQRAELDAEVKRLLDKIETEQTQRSLLNERWQKLEEQKTEDMLQIQMLKAAREQMRERITGALEMLALMGLTPEKYPWVVQAVTAYINVDPEKGWMRLHELSSNILSENRNSAKEALKQFYEVTRPAIESGYVSPQELKEVVQMLIPALSGADMNNYFQTDKMLDAGDKSDASGELEYTGPELDTYDDYRAEENMEESNLEAMEETEDQMTFSEDDIKSASATPDVDTDAPYDESVTCSSDPVELDKDDIEMPEETYSGSLDREPENTIIYSDNFLDDTEQDETPLHSLDTDETQDNDETNVSS